MFAPSQKRDNSDSSECAKMKCRCGLEAALKVSSSGRKYLGCPRRAGAGQCEFTRMLPDNAQEGTSPTQTLHANHMAERSITASQNEIDPNFAHPPSLGPVNAMKRTLPAKESEEDHLLPLQKRTRMIEAALKESPQDSMSAAQQRIIAIQEALGKVNSPPREPPTFGLLKYPEVRAEDIVNGSSQSIGSSSGKTGSSSLDAPSSRAANTDKPWLLQTPKRPEFKRSASTTSGLSSPEQSPVQIGKKYRTSEEWYNSAVLSEAATSKKQYSALSVTTALEDLSGLPQFLRTLEKGHQIKDMKIKHLENEVQRLKSKQGELEKLLQMYEQQHSPIIDPGA